MDHLQRGENSLFSMKKRQILLHFVRPSLLWLEDIEISYGCIINLRSETRV